jgi:hypothetical protein
MPPAEETTDRLYRDPVMRQQLAPAWYNVNHVRTPGIVATRFDRA